MDGADPYSDGILKTPIVIDNVSKSSFSTCLAGDVSKLNSSAIGIRCDQGRLRRRGAPAKDIQCLVRDQKV
jgi:hypothetical protein